MALPSDCSRETPFAGDCQFDRDCARGVRGVRIISSYLAFGAAQEIDCTGSRLLHGAFRLPKLREPLSSGASARKNHRIHFPFQDGGE